MNARTPWAWRLPRGKVPLIYAAKLGSLSYNQQFPSGTSHRRDRKTGDEDDSFTRSRVRFAGCFPPDGKQVLYVTRYETESGLRLRTWKAAKTVG